MADALIKLSPSDAPERFIAVPRKVALMSVTIKNMLEDFGDAAVDTPIPLHNVTYAILAKVVAFCEHHVNASAAPAPASAAEDGAEKKKQEDATEIDPWSKEFLDVPQATLFELILAANYLDIKVLLDLSCRTVANMVKGKTPEEIRVTFNIKNDFSPEEEEKVRRENEWAEER